MLPPEMMVMNAQDILEGLVGAVEAFKPKQTFNHTSSQQNTANSTRDKLYTVISIVILSLFVFT